MQITHALVKVMAKEGYDGASIGAIAREAGLAPGLVHYHFRNKQEILLAALGEIVARNERALETRLAAAADDPVAEVAAFIDVHLGLGAHADPEALACWILLGGEALRQPEVHLAYAAALQGAVARLNGVLGAGVARGVFTCASTEAIAAAIVATIQGYFVLAATAPGAVPKGSAAACTHAMAAGLLGAPRAAR